MFTREELLWNSNLAQWVVLSFEQVAQSLTGPIYGRGKGPATQHVIQTCRWQATWVQVDCEPQWIVESLMSRWVQVKTVCCG